MQKQSIQKEKKRKKKTLEIEYFDNWGRSIFKAYINNISEAREVAENNPVWGTKKEKPVTAIVDGKTRVTVFDPDFPNLWYVE